MTIISAVADLIRNCDTRRIMPMQSRVDMLSPPAAFSPRVGVMHPVLRELGTAVNRMRPARESNPGQSA